MTRRLPALLGACLSFALVYPVRAQSPRSLADLRWIEPETPAGRFVIAPGERAMVSGYARSGLEVWIYPLQLLRAYDVTFRVEGATHVTL